MLTAANEAVEQLQTSLKGKLVRPEDASYDTTRALYNAMIDKRPAPCADCSMSRCSRCDQCGELRT